MSEDIVAWLKEISKGINDSPLEEITTQLKRIADALEKAVQNQEKIWLSMNGIQTESAGEKEEKPTLATIGVETRAGKDVHISDSKPAPQEESKWIEFKGMMRGFTPKAVQILIPNDTKQWFPRKQVVNIDEIEEDNTTEYQFFKVTRWIANQKGIEHILEGRD